MTSTKLFSSALVDLGLDTEDPGLAPPGARCGEAGLCEHQQCVPLEDVLVLCPDLCSGHGACDNTRTCHCDPGWTGATCNVSRDSVTILVALFGSVTLLVTCFLLLRRLLCPHRLGVGGRGDELSVLIERSEAGDQWLTQTSHQLPVPRAFQL